MKFSAFILKLPVDLFKITEYNTEVGFILENADNSRC